MAAEVAYLLSAHSPACFCLSLPLIANAAGPCISSIHHMQLKGSMSFFEW